MKTFPVPIQQFIQQAVNTILPPRCILTGQFVDAQGTLSPEAWSQLEFIAEPCCETCGFPFDFEVEEGSLCASCIDFPPRFESARAALKYGEGSRQIILGFKHADKIHALPSLIPWIKRAGKSMLSCADLLIPVPLHYRRLLARRYNQSALIAYALSKETGIAVLPDGLKRIRSTPPQGHLSAKERYKNVRSAFAVTPEHAGTLKGKTVVIIDDVYTTGATVNECTKALKKAGVKAVHILTLARVARDGFG